MFSEFLKKFSFFHEFKKLEKILICLETLSLAINFFKNNFKKL